VRVRHSATAAVALLILVAATSCSSTSSRTTKGNACTPAKPQPAGQSTVHIASGGLDRDYILYVPRSYRGTTAVPVIFNFHGYGSTPAQQMGYGDFRPLAERDDFLIVAPEGENAPIGRHWNASQLPGQPDDVAFTFSILDSIEKDFCVDAHRVFSTGMSDGGAMTSLLACVGSNRLAAFGPVAVLFYTPACSSARSIPIAAFMGDADPVVPFNGGRINCCDHSTVLSVPASMARWAAHDGCAAQAHETKPSSEVTLREWTRCKAPGAVRFYIINGGGHTWPGSVDVPFLGKTTHQINATDVLWAFFQAHPLPR